MNEMSKVSGSLQSSASVSESVSAEDCAWSIPPLVAGSDTTALSVAAFSVVVMVVVCDNVVALDFTVVVVVVVEDVAEIDAVVVDVAAVENVSVGTASLIVVVDVVVWC